MGFIGGIWLALLGVLAAPNLLLSRKPEARQWLDKIAPYQGWIGAISALWGALVILGALLNLRWLRHALIYWVTYAADGVLLLCLGLLLGVGVLKQFIKAPQAVEKMDQTIARLAPKQGVLGIVAICLGVWAVISNFLWRIG
ncbi:MAG: hypothetical protein JXR83_12205 [Deltaproteobacteria bacterium]|nr:hypothetical protein [Deltaproteobacteria bacterium]